MGSLLALLTHDLRNPLSALQSNLGYLASILSRADEDTREAVADGLISCEALAQMIDNMDLLGRFLGGEVESEPRSVDIGTIVRSELARAASLAGSHGTRLEPDGSVDAVLSRVQADPALLGQLVQNLLRNAIQHAPPGSAVRVGVLHEDGRLVVEVSDDGEAIDPSLRGTVFTARGQVDSKAARTGRYSRGLGLFAAGLAAQAIGVGLSAHPSAGGGGNVFRVSLPA